MKKPPCDEISGWRGNRKADRDNGKTSVGGVLPYDTQTVLRVFSTQDVLYLKISRC